MGLALWSIRRIDVDSVEHTFILTWTADSLLLVCALIVKVLLVLRDFDIVLPRQEHLLLLVGAVTSRRIFVKAALAVDSLLIGRRVE